MTAYNFLFSEKSCQNDQRRMFLKKGAIDKEGVIFEKEGPNFFYNYYNQAPPFLQLRKLCLVHYQISGTVLVIFFCLQCVCIQQKLLDSQQGK